MKYNKRILHLCNLQNVIFVLFGASVLLHFVESSHLKSGWGVLLQILLLMMAVVGCAVTLALRDYVNSVMKNATIDVAGIHNKKALEKKIRQLQEQDDTLNIGIMMFDLNNLKKVNDTCGHEAGDVFIRNFASFLTRILTADSFLARYGGDEFMIVQEHTTPEELDAMEERLQKIVAEYNQQAEHEISYAVGYEVSYKNHYYLVTDLIKIADEKMYLDKAEKKRARAGQGENSILDEHTVKSRSSSAGELAGKLSAVLAKQEPESQYAFLLMDVKEFHLINDYWGYETGNEVLRTVLGKLQAFPKVQFAYRFHSDIFACLFDCKDETEAEFLERLGTYKEMISEEILQRYPIQYFSLNTGIYFIPTGNGAVSHAGLPADLPPESQALWCAKRSEHLPEDPETDVDHMISHTNTARKKAQNMPGGICVYSEQLAGEEQQKADVLHSFAQALEKEEFQIYFQPKIEGKAQQITSAEVLVRWLRADGTLWTPDRFLPILEENGYVLSLDYYVYEKAFQWLKHYQSRHPKGLSISLNISPAHFRDVKKFTGDVLALIEKYGIDTHDLIFEITENVYIHNIEAVNAMIQTFHSRGIRISMDDFGSGYSSLNTLKDIAFDEVKIDKRFLEGSLSENGRIVLQEIFHLLKRTKKTIVCEGVETSETAEFLIHAGCDELQGYYYYRPMAAGEFEKVMEGIQG